MSDSTQHNIVDHGDLRHYRTELPNLIDDLPLSVYAHRLYSHVKRVCGGNGGTCRESTREMAKRTRMSVGKVIDAKRELFNFCLMEKVGTYPTPNGPADELSVKDIWAINMATYGPANRGLSMSVRVVNALSALGVQDTNPPGSPDERSEVTHGKEHEEAAPAFADAPPEPEDEDTLPPSESEPYQNSLLPSPPALGTKSDKPVKVTTGRATAERLATVSLHQQYMAGYQDALGYPIPDGGRAAKAAKQAIARAIPLEELLRCYRWKKATARFYRVKDGEANHLPLDVIVNGFGAWQQAGSPLAPGETREREREPWNDSELPPPPAASSAPSLDMRDTESDPDEEERALAELRATFGPDYGKF